MIARIALAVALALAAFALGAQAAHAQQVADFFRGKTVTMLIGYTSGGGYDLYARVLSKHMGRHIPGSPSIVPQNMPGAGSLRAANVLYNTASKDGLTIGMIGRGMAMAQLIGASQPPAPSTTTRYTTFGAVEIRSRSNSRSSRSREISMCSRPKNPQRNPNPSATEVSGS